MLGSSEWGGGQQRIEKETDGRTAAFVRGCFCPLEKRQQQIGVVNRLRGKRPFLSEVSFVRVDE